ncbi:hypothetical protein M404DRAFT_992153, partial [Pisolithus tinctorius Marx 270]
MSNLSRNPLSHIHVDFYAATPFIADPYHTSQGIRRIIIIFQNHYLSIFSCSGSEIGIHGYPQHTGFRPSVDVLAVLSSQHAGTTQIMLSTSHSLRSIPARRPPVGTISEWTHTAVL